MAIQNFQLDPNAVAYTDDQIVGKVNTATANITRASSVTATARPIAAGEIGNDEIEAAAGIEKSKLAALAIVDADVDAAAGIVKTKLAALGIVDADVDAAAGIVKTKLAALEIEDSDVAAAAAIAKSKLAALAIVNADVDAGAAIAKSKLAALAIVNADVDAGAAIVGSKLASTAAKDNLDALADTARGYIKTDPQTGEFKIIAMQRDADDKLDVEYDDVAV